MGSPSAMHENGENTRFRDDLYFLSGKAADALPNFAYSGEDHSLLYKHVLSPLAGYFVDHCTPRTIAPNSITLCGLCFMIMSYCVMWYHVPNLEADTSQPGWIFLLNCVAMLVYQTLDNMDGKQARRTGSSSPLGLLFDHGCDAINSAFGSANWIISIGLHATNDAGKLFALVVGPMALFYVATWEEFYTGKLELPIVNGPNEGLVLGALTSLTTCFLGVSFWQGTLWFDTIVKPYVFPLMPAFAQAWVPAVGWTNADIQVLMACIGFFQETLAKCLTVARKYGVQALWNMLPFVMLATLTLVIGICDVHIWTRMPRTSIHLCSGLFVEMCTQLMLDHMTKERFQPYRWVLVPLLALTILVISGQLQASSTTDEMLLIYASALWAYLLMKMSIVIYEICSVLNIWCFDITSPRKPGAVQNLNGATPSFASVSTQRKLQ